VTQFRGAITYFTESIHGAGSLQNRKIVIQRYGDFEQKKRQTRAIAGITA